MKRIIFVVMVLALVMNAVSGFAKSDMFGNAHNDANEMKAEQLAASKHVKSSAKAIEDETFFDDSAVNANTLKQEQLAIRKKFVSESVIEDNFSACTIIIHN